jgi:LmbE family N-acetylglucosaminyl deacetylase
MRADAVLHRLCERAAGSDTPATLIVAAHPDDETIGAGARIAAIARSCVVLHLTDGAPNDRRFFPEVAGNVSRAAYARTRREEAVRALALAGVPEASVVCLRIRDQEVAHELVRAAEAVAAVLLERRPEVVVTHPYEGGHPDHDAAAFAVQAAKAMARAGGLERLTIVEMTSYHDRSGLTVRGEFLPRDTPCDEIALELDEDERRRKRAMLATYVTQREVLAPFRIEAERFRIAPSYDFRAPPHAGRLHYERFGTRMPGAMWRAFARAALKKLALQEEKP